MHRRILPSWTPKVATVLTAVLASLITSSATVPVALWALRPPIQLHRLWLAIGACVVAIGLGALLGRALARIVLRWTERRRGERRQPRVAGGADRRQSGYART